MSEDELILTHIFKCSRSSYYLQKPQLSQQQQAEFQSIKLRRSQGEPLQYILGSCDFMGLELKVDARVLVPRPETEVLVDLALKKFKGTAILDIGTGSGNIAIALAKHLPQAKIITVDISKDAQSLARENAINHKVQGQIEFVGCDIATYKTQQKFDLVISNPPYIPKARMAQLPIDVQKEPLLALDGGLDGLDFYRTIIKMIPGLIRAGGCLMMEFGDGQALAIRELISKSQLFPNITIHQDLAGKDRIICAP